MRYTLPSLVLLSFIVSFPARAQLHFGPEERRILTLTDERRNADSLLPYLASPSARISRRAAIGIANIGDTTVRAALLKAYLLETRDSVADAEAFALGMLGPMTSAQEELVMQQALQHP